MKAKNAEEKIQVWWTMIHTLDFIKFSFLDNLEVVEELEKAKEAYYNLMKLANIYAKNNIKTH